MNKIETACIIDDDPIFVFAAKRMMHLANFCESFMIFHNGKKALESLEPLMRSGENLPEIILLDLNMPVMDGWQFLDQFVQIPTKKKTTIYIVTSSIDPEDLNRAKSYEAVTNYLVKPINIDTLTEILKDFSKSA
ncbi:MAG: CheY-like chemotaxis protein [Roseivirga sp.]|jgi:CheY-like chemotaxis protein